MNFKSNQNFSVYWRFFANENRKVALMSYFHTSSKEIFLLLTDVFRIRVVNYVFFRTAIRSHQEAFSFFPSFQAFFSFLIFIVFTLLKGASAEKKCGKWIEGVPIMRDSGNFKVLSNSSDNYTRHSFMGVPLDIFLQALPVLHSPLFERLQ